MNKCVYRQMVREIKGEEREKETNRKKERN